MSGVGLVVGALINDLLALNPAFSEYALKNSKSVIFLNSLIVGASLGVCQWFILRKYLPGWWWIVATCVGWSISTVFARAWQDYIGGSLSSIFYIWLGITGWLLLRRKVFTAWWWLFIAPFSIYVFKLTAAIVFFALMQVNLSGWRTPSVILIQNTSGVVFGLIQALILCIFRKKSGKNSASISELDLPLFLAKEITDSGQIQALAQKLRYKIERAWQKKTNLTQKLIYIVAIASDGSIVFYHPVNQPAINHINLTPLPNLVESKYTGGVAVEQLVARFRVVFTPSGGLEIRY